jgi:Flp pilus assembly protein TadG
MMMLIEKATGRLTAAVIRSPLCRRFLASRRGVAAVEFAVVMPVLLILFLSTFDVGNAIIVYMKVRAATYELAAITNQYGTTVSPAGQISTSTMSTISAAGASILSPYSSTPLTIIITQIKATSNTQAVVSWSYALNGTPYTVGTTFSLPANLANNTCGSGTYNAVAPPSGLGGCYLILSQVSYSYTPMFGAFMTGTLALSDNLYVAPRSTACVQYNSTPTLSSNNSCP